MAPAGAPATTPSLLGAFGLFYAAIAVSQLAGLARTNRRDLSGGS